MLPPERTESADGHELSLATHVLGPIALTELLLPQLAQSADSRVVFMSSGGMYTAELPVDDVDYRRGEYRSVGHETDLSTIASPGRSRRTDRRLGGARPRVGRGKNFSPAPIRPASRSE